MEIINCKSNDIMLFFESVDKLLDLIKETFENNSSALNRESFLTNNDVSNMLHISQRTLQDWRDTGKIAYIQISGKVLYKESDVKRLLEENYYDVFKG